MLVHAGGMLADATLGRQTLAGIRKVFAAKVTAAQQAHACCASDPSSGRLLFSSVAALLGSAGQANYSAANGVLDGMAGQWQGEGRGGVSSIQWGGWAGGGMAGADPTTASRLARMGMPLIQPQQGLAALEAVLTQLQQGHIPAALAAVPLDATALVKTGNLPAITAPLLADLASFSPEGVTATPRALTSVSTAAAVEQVDIADVFDKVSFAVQCILGWDVPASQPLMAAGLDSLSSLELTNTLQSSLGQQLPPTLIFDYPTIQAITDYITRDTATAQTAQAVPVTVAVGFSPHQQASAQHTLLLDTVSIAPGRSLSSLSPRDCIGLVPLDRWDLDAQPDGANVARFGAYLGNADSFDAACFGISHAEAVLMDPQQRLLMQALAQASSSVGFAEALRSVQQGVYVGIASSDYATLLKQHSSKGSFHATANASSVASGRLSYTFGLKGPSMSIDTACSSSLVAVHLAHHGILNRQAGLSYAAGVHVQCSQTSTSYVWAAGMLSSQGRCQVADAAADGYVRGEACAVVTLASPKLVQTDDGQVLAVLRGSAVGQDGRSSSLTAPNGPSQQQAIREALETALLQPENINALQLHGTGTCAELLSLVPIVRSAVLVLLALNFIQHCIAYTPESIDSIV